MLINFYGFYYWLKGKRQDHEIRIEPIAAKMVLMQMCLKIGGLLFGLTLKHFTDAAVPLLDAQLAAFKCFWSTRRRSSRAIPAGCWRSRR